MILAERHYAFHTWRIMALQHEDSAFARQSGTWRTLAKRGSQCISSDPSGYKSRSITKSRRRHCESLAVLTTDRTTTFFLVFWEGFRSCLFRNPFSHYHFFFCKWGKWRYCHVLLMNFPRWSVWMYYVIHVGRRQRSALPAKSVLKSGLWRREPLGRYKKHIVSPQAILTVTFALTIFKQDILIHTVCNSCFSCTPVCTIRVLGSGLVVFVEPRWVLIAAASMLLFNSTAE